MKTIRWTLIFMLISIAICGIASAEEMSFDVEMETTARLVDIEGSPHFTAKGRGALVVDKYEGGADIIGKSIPTMIYESDDPPADLGALTITVTGVIGNRAEIDWSDYPVTRLKRLALHIRAYEALADEIDEVRPFIETTISGIDLSTEEITVGGVSSGGYIDMKNLEAQLAGKVIAPDGSDPLYDEHIAGQPILLELLVKTKNFLRK